MRTMLGLAALALAATAPSVSPAQNYGVPTGSYQRQCTDIQVNGQFLTARCRGAYGSGSSSINIASCASDIGVDAEGGLVCLGPAASGAAPYATGPAPRYADPRYADPRYADPRYADPRYADPRYVDPRYAAPRYAAPYAPGSPAPRYTTPGYGAYRGGGEGVTLFGGNNWRGEPIWIEGDVANLDWTGLNDRVRSIQLQRGSGAWQVCTDAGYRGRCETITRSVPDTRALGMGDSISSLRPLY